MALGISTRSSYLKVLSKTRSTWSKPSDASGADVARCSNLSPRYVRQRGEKVDCGLLRPLLQIHLLLVEKDPSSVLAVVARSVREDWDVAVLDHIHSWATRLGLCATRSHGAKELFLVESSATSLRITGNRAVSKPKISQGTLGVTKRGQSCRKRSLAQRKS